MMSADDWLRPKEIRNVVLCDGLCRTSVIIFNRDNVGHGRSTTFVWPRRVIAGFGVKNAVANFELDLF